MSLFEFVLTGFTLVLALVITRVLGGLRWVLAAGRVYWVHATFVFVLLVFASLVWWELWYQRNNQWNYLSFAYNLLIGPGVMYFISVLLVPEQPRRITNWRAYFYAVRRMFYGTLAGMMIAAFIGAIGITHTQLGHPGQVLMAFGLLLAVLGYRSESHAMHAGIAVVLAILVAIAVALVQTAPVR
ncbi:MAG: hypothetical protein H6993_14880 [Pseudomonadales bacterium]|nr:hypothetical protein [Pseudomonadales bacterium]